jgi:threonylcarbamoyladenosine tRNA methylthiotransferase MtaB
VNESDSDLLRANLLVSGFEESSPEEADLILVNSCYVTREAGRKSRKTARRFKRLNPKARVVLFGCYGVGGGDFAPGEVEVVRGGVERVLEYLGVERTLEHPINVQRTRYYLKVEDGCSMNCAYCVIRDLRGPVRSKPLDLILKEVEAALTEGHPEVVLVGVNLNLYSSEGTDFLGLLRKLDREFGGGSVRFRLSSLNPALVDEEFVEVVASLPSVTPYFHFSFQHVSERVLRLMRRGYGSEKVHGLLDKVFGLYSNVGLSADFIVGFWGEGEKEFEELLEFLSVPRFDRVHIFPYSEHNGYVVEGESLLPFERRRERARIALDVARVSTMMRLSGRLGEVHEVLVEKRIAEKYYGHSEYYDEVFFRGEAEMGGLVKVSIIGIERNWGYLLGEVRGDG